MVKWLWRSVSNFAKSTRVGSNPVVGTTNHESTVNSAVHPSEVDKRALRDSSEGTSSNAASPQQQYGCRIPSLR